MYEFILLDLIPYNRSFVSDVSISGRADLVDDNIKKKDLWNDSLKAW
jgi:general stress protein 26